jgi:hypothetical protein
MPLRFADMTDQEQTLVLDLANPLPRDLEFVGNLGHAVALALIPSRYV